jgi:hypothetical protein
MIEQHHIGKENAIALYATHWWEDKTAREIVEFQLFTAELAMPFDKFQQAMEEALNRPVFTHEFGLNFEGLVKEFLGEIPTPSFAQIVQQLEDQIGKDRIIGLVV